MGSGIDADLICPPMDRGQLVIFMMDTVPRVNYQPGPPSGDQPPASYPPASYGEPSRQPAAMPGAPYANYPPPSGAPGYPDTSGHRRAPGTNGFAIASLIFGILGGVVFSVIFGIVALVQVRKRGQRGRGLAIAGLSLSVVWLVALGVGIVLLTMEKSPNYSGNVSVTRLNAGDCVNGLKDGSSVEAVPKVPCAQPHEGEVFAVYDLASGAWPGEDAVAKQAEQGCQDRFDKYTSSTDSTIQLFYLQPLKDSWSVDRSVTCIATKPGTRTTGRLPK